MVLPEQRAISLRWQHIYKEISLKYVYVIPPKCKQLLFRSVKHFVFRGKKVFAWNFIPLFYFLVKYAAEARRILVVMLKTIRINLFRRFKNNDYEALLHNAQSLAELAKSLALGSHSTFEMFEDIKNYSKGKTLGTYE